MLASPQIAESLADFRIDGRHSAADAHWPGNSTEGSGAKSQVATRTTMNGALGFLKAHELSAAKVRQTKRSAF